MFRTFSILLVVAILTGCVAWQKLPHREVTLSDKSNSYEVTHSDGWIRLGDNKADSVFLTKDGPMLQFIEVQQLDAEKPFENIDQKVSESTLITEVADYLLADMKAKESGLTINKLEMVPYDQQGHEGFRMKLSIIDKKGLETHLLVYGFAEQGKVYKLSYAAPKLFYFERNLPEFENLVASFKVLHTPLIAKAK